MGADVISLVALVYKLNRDLVCSLVKAHVKCTPNLAV